MNNIVSKYGTFMVIPLILIIVFIIGFNLKTTTRTTVHMVQHQNGMVDIFIPHSVDTTGIVTDSVHLDNPQGGHISYPVVRRHEGATGTFITCRGHILGNEPYATATITTAELPLWKVIVSEL